MSERFQQSREKTTRTKQQFYSQPSVYLLIFGRRYCVGGSEALWRSSVREFAHTHSQGQVENRRVTSKKKKKK